jgi:hypothetical protein
MTCQKMQNNVGRILIIAYDVQCRIKHIEAHKNDGK